VREVTYRCLWKANDLSQKLSKTLTLVLIGARDEPFLMSSRKGGQGHCRDLQEFNGDLYKEISQADPGTQPLLTLVAHTPWGMDFARRSR